MRLFIPITKIDEEKREVHGTLTHEIVDRDNEILDYDSSKPYFEKWSNYFSEATGGKSVGNLRAMHKNISAGKLTSISFDDINKKIDIVAKVVDDAEWAKCLEGVYTGFSAAGRTIKSWKDGSSRRYTADPYEASLADLPAVPTATFSHVKTGGSVEQRRFLKYDTKGAASETIVFADKGNFRFPLNTPSRRRLALAMWSFEKIRSAYDEKEQEVIGAAIRNAARADGLTVTEKAINAGDFKKGLYDVGSLASAIEGLRWIQQSARYEREYEGDDSSVPDMLLDQVVGLTETLKEMVGEECDELLEILGAIEKETTKTTGSTSMANDKTTETPAALTADDESFAKRFTNAHKTKVAALHEHAKTVHAAMGDAHKALGKVVKTMGEHCAKLAAFSDEVAGQNDKKPSGDEDSSAASMKTAGAQASDGSTTDTTQGDDVTNEDFQKLTASVEELKGQVKAATEQAKAATDRAVAAEAQRDEFQKTAVELAEMGEKLLAAGASRPGVLRAIAKGDEIVDDKKEKVADAPKTAVDAFKKAFGNPEIVTGVPGANSRA